ncbi:MAG: phosphoribosylformylglycinamidine synthase subunit PurQ [Zymomonas mobilis subsp. pomaceae]|uniref:Phosphoribosylformylglycinamidine synthase subunit PurQ n=1 Tax=Zymomonas mobilis subsp. pomaceae (strain ATCC 29192 / DSM 22645 / JCM 10191 / CCUG 17912 / NBRC 13757 / NCIMB 11200 / NRRL B-4491 / Barker I) TaxID=579138 RepID=F8EW47_ZYMMT|nr:phosphoribosylformylglycinamidine synthase subunit PurQ [Zymomonas mobilis]AEI38457.1 phosphoribosylformylglycinamidine synthase I [Zymomonas mobilis subsp. pomaceae ATCC 29192]MDX5948146.1 phosphoribosylformylglycinamidine synthase subunit PurQ [Zymomonas mobilis subsp. pomaceae]GEB89743.1 phosphoribosylformylglycinamidine synthase subunit PurQ [Zymomonas mobilis subsp. pomaceae]
MKAAVLVFPGSNCDRDMAVAIEKICGTKPMMVWHQETDLPNNLDLIALPGGFSYGDYLRSGAMAARSAVMSAVIKQAERGVAVMGICNGFQILTEAGLLPGALMRNAGLSFICRDVGLEVVNTTSSFTRLYQKNEKIRLPVAHHDGNFTADEATLNQLEDEDRIALRYTESVNGSVRNIAGILNKKGNVLGLMPHPERMIEAAHKGTDGYNFFASLTKVLA